MWPRGHHQTRSDFTGVRKAYFPVHLERLVTWSAVTSHDRKWSPATQKWHHQARIDFTVLGKVCVMGAWVTQKCHHFTRSALDKAVEGRQIAFWVRFSSTGLYLTGGASHVEGNDMKRRMWHHFTEIPSSSKCSYMLQLPIKFILLFGNLPCSEFEYQL